MVESCEGFDVAEEQGSRVTPKQEVGHMISPLVANLVPEPEWCSRIRSTVGLKSNLSSQLRSNRLSYSTCEKFVDENHLPGICLPLDLVKGRRIGRQRSKSSWPISA